jgi:hypothetical protein
MESDLGPDAARLTTNDWQTGYANARMLIEDTVKAQGGVGGTRTTLAEQLTPTLGKEGVADFLNTVNRLPNSLDIADRLLTGGTGRTLVYGNASGVDDADGDAKPGLADSLLHTILGLRDTSLAQPDRAGPVYWDTSLPPLPVPNGRVASMASVRPSVSSLPPPPPAAPGTRRGRRQHHDLPLPPWSRSAVLPPPS